MASGASGGTKLMAALGAIADRAGAAHVRVGFLENATAPDGTPEAQIAFWNEFGKDGSEGEPKQPPRPFFRRMIADVTPQVSGWTDKALEATGMDTSKALALMGEKLQDALVESIHKLRDPPLAQSTIDRKGFDKPLIHHNDMVRSVAYEVVEGSATENSE